MLCVYAKSCTLLRLTHHVLGGISKLFFLVHSDVKLTLVPHSRVHCYKLLVPAAAIIVNTMRTSVPCKSQLALIPPPPLLTS